MRVEEGELLWTPSQAFAESSNIAKFIRWLNRTRGLNLSDYQALWQWSVSELADFWAALWDYYDIQSDGDYEQVVSGLEMRPGQKWFSGAKLNMAEHIMRAFKPGKPAIHHLSEIREVQTINGDELAGHIRTLATAMRARGVRPGDMVCAVMPNIAETTIAMLATLAIGAVWSLAAPEFGINTILDRFTQIRPKWLFLVDGYAFAGKTFNRASDNAALVDELANDLAQIIHVPYVEPDGTAPDFGHIATGMWGELLGGDDPGAANFIFERLAFDDPMWVLFSSGTTGLPKAIVHGHVGSTVEMYKIMSFHLNMGPDSVSFFYSSSGWVMYNLTVTMMITGSAIIQYDGNPAYPSVDVLWKMAADLGATMFGASPTYIQLMDAHGIVPKERYDLSKMNTVLLGGSPSTPENFKWFYDKVNPDLWLTSQSGGTEILSAFVGATPTQPVYAGEIQCRCLAMAVESWSDAGESVIDEVGELVCTRAFPSMPIYFLGDEGGERYQDSYFNHFDGVWQHGDFLKINARGGCYIYGRSDSTLNRFGVRIGTAELYRCIEKIPQVSDSLVVCMELDEGKFFMPMFVQLTEGESLTEELVRKMSTRLRKECSPRHVPDTYYAVPQIPYTLTGKKQEIPIRKLLMGWPLAKCVSRDAMRNPDAIDWFLEYVATTTDYEVPKVRGRG